jgi:hypothetical protein
MTTFVMMMRSVDIWGWLAIATTLVMLGVWAVRAAHPIWVARLLRAFALIRRVTREGLRRDVITRRLVWALALIIVVVIWNGRRVVNAVIAPIWGLIGHYENLVSVARNVLLSAVALYVAYRTTRSP